MKIKSIHCGDTLHIYDADSNACTDSVNKDVQRQINRGHTRYHKDGSREFITHDVIHDLDTDTYIWDKSGDKVKHNTIHNLVTKDGVQTTKIIGTTYRKF